MQINLFNSKNPNGKRVPVSVTIEHIDLQPTNDGELVYVISLATGARDINGNRIDTVYINNVTDRTFKSEINKALSIIAPQINWGNLEEDIYPPLIMEMIPERNDSNVNINTDLYIQLKDPFPASFINTTTLSLKVNGVDVTSAVKVLEKDNQVFLQWTPIRVLD